MKIIDIGGKIIGDWTVLSRALSKNRQTHWLVRCKCGIEKILSSQNIRKSISCHKCAMERISEKLNPGDVFGIWVLVAPAQPKNGQRWLCKCSCGKECVIPLRTLNSGTSTGCFECGRIKLRKFVNGIPQWLITQTKRSAKNRDLEFNLSIEYLAKVFDKQDGICPLTGFKLKFSTAPKKSEETTASPDRIDNSKGYIEGNVRFVHKIVNKMRNNMSDEEFLKWCRCVVNYSCS